jgi:hypothetical protein
VGGDNLCPCIMICLGLSPSHAWTWTHSALLQQGERGGVSGECCSALAGSAVLTTPDHVSCLEPSRCLLLTLLLLLPPGLPLQPW